MKEGKYNYYYPGNNNFGFCCFTAYYGE